MAGHERGKILDSLVSLCGGVSLVHTATLKGWGSNEVAGTARPLVNIQVLTDDITHSVGVEMYHKMLVRLKLSVANDVNGKTLIGILEDLEDAINDSVYLGGNCDLCKTKLIDPPELGINGTASMYITVQYRRTR